MNTRAGITFYAVIALFVQPFFSQSVQAQEDDAAKLADIINAVAQGWEQADGTPFRAHYLDFEGARYIEGGGQNVGLSDLVGHHVEPEGDTLDSLKLQFSNIESHVEGDFAWAIADTEIKATVKSDKREIHNRGYETFLFRRVDGEWKVVHTHSSSRAVVKESDHEH
jgi:SnoaL-like protein